VRTLLGGLSLEGTKRKGKTMETNTTPAEQFAEDFLMVMTNDYEAYGELLKTAEEAGNLVALSDVLRDEYEQLTEQVTALVENKISPIAGQLIGELLNGWGSTPFDLIARDLLNRLSEIDRVKGY